MSFPFSVVSVERGDQHGFYILLDELAAKLEV